MTKRRRKIWNHNELAIFNDLKFLRTCAYADYDTSLHNPLRDRDILAITAC